MFRNMYRYLGLNQVKNKHRDVLGVTIFKFKSDTIVTLLNRVALWSNFFSYNFIIRNLLLVIKNKR